MDDEFEISMMGDLNFFLVLQIKQIEDEIFFNQSKYIKEMLKKFRLEDSKPTKTQMSSEIKLTKDDEPDSMDSSKYRGTKMPSEYQQDYKNTRAYALKIYNDPSMSDILRDIYRTLESRYVYEGITINPSFYNDLSDDSVAKFTTIGFDCLLSLDEKIYPRPCELVIRENVYSAIRNRYHTQAIIALMLYCLENKQPFNLAHFIIRRMYFCRDRRDKVLPYGMILTRLFKNLKANMAQGSFDERYKLVSRRMSLLKAKHPKKPPPKRTRNVGKTKRTQLSTSSSTESPPSDNGDFSSIKLSPRKTIRISVKYPNYVNITSLSEEQPNERTPSPPPRKKSFSPLQAPSKSISIKSTHYTSSSSPSESLTTTHVAPPPKLHFVIPIKQEHQELPPLQMSLNDPYTQTMDNWPSGPSNPSPPPRVSRPPPGFPIPPLEFKPLLSTQLLFVNINNNTPLLHNNVPPLENIHHPPPSLGNQDFPNPSNILDCVYPNDLPYLHNMFCQFEDFQVSAPFFIIRSIQSQVKLGDDASFLGSYHRVVSFSGHQYLPTETMKLYKLFQLAYDVHTCRMISQLVIILEGDMCTSGNVVTNSRVTPSWREIVSLTF
nr:retrovirus-related Pol polyprotein from transposon TNT 1-94 [Tanacetum cinerariifolium]